MHNCTLLGLRGGSLGTKAYSIGFVVAVNSSPSQLVRV